MAITLTFEEYESIKNRLYNKYIKAVHKLRKDNAYGLSSIDKSYNQCKELFIYKKMIDTYQQSKYTELEFVNFINSRIVQNTLVTIKKIL